MKTLKFATLITLGLLFFIPTPSSAYTWQDVQNYLNAHPAPSGCYNWTEAVTTSSGNGYKVWRRCGGDTTLSSWEVEYSGGTLVDSCIGLPVEMCDGSGRNFISSKKECYRFTNGAKAEITLYYCSGRSTVETTPASIYGVSNPCFAINHVYPSACTSLDTLLATFIPVTNCVDNDYDGYYAYNATSCPQGNDCNDGNSKINPGAAEECDGKDNNCNGETDEGEACKCQLNTGGFSTANIASGNLHHDQELFSTRGTGLTTNITLHFNSIYGYNGPLGNGWGHTYDIWLKEYSDGSVLLRNGNERRLYIKSGNSYTSQPGDYSTLTKNPDGTFTITHKDGTKDYFNGINKISSITDRNGNATTFAYSAGGDLITITDSDGRTTTLNYNTDHRISAINDPNGNNHSFVYSGNDLVGVTTQPDGSQSAPASWSYTYYDNSFMKTKTDPNGNTTTYAYDANHRVATSTDPEGNVKSIAYPSPDDTNQSKPTTVTEKDGGVWTYTYDTEAGTLTQKTDPENGTTSYTYDENRNMTSKTESDGSVTSYTYDINGNMTSQTDALGQTTSYTYNSYGQVTGITAPDNMTTTYEYDAKGNLTQIKDAAGQITTYSYDSRGNVVQITNAAGQTTKFTYDQNNNLSSITDPTGATTSFTYDTAGNMTSQTDASGNTTRFEYNSLGRLIKVIDPSGNATNSTYDANGNKTSETDANGNTTYYEYNYKGQLIKVKDALGNVTTYTYGGTGCSSCGGGVDKLTQITDANGNSTKYEYDRLGRLIKETDPLGNSTSYSYDSKGNLTSKKDANGNTTTYDSLNRLISINYPDATKTTFTYDTKGNIITAGNQYISYTFAYDANGRMTNVTDSNGRVINYEYNILGSKTKMIYPDGSVVNYAYDKANRLSSIVNGGGRTYSFQYDSVGRRTSLTYPNSTFTTYTYDTAGRLTNLIHKTSTGAVIDSFSYTHDKVGNRLTKTGVDTKYTYSYDNIYRLLQSLPTKLQGKDKEQENKAENFSYDAVGNRLNGPATKDAYSYNQGNQLASDRKHQYQYDRNGNLIKKIETEDDGETEATTYSYDYENRLIKVVKQEEDETKTVSFKYDPFGRRIEKKVEKTEDGKIETKTYTYIYDNEDVILEYVTKAEDGQSKTEKTRYIHGPGIDEPLSIQRKDETYYYHADGLGSIVALTDKKQKMVESYSYDSFGNMKRKGDKVKNTFTYTAREWDEEIYLFFNRARYYDPMNGRFISYDPILHPANVTSKVKSCSQSSSHHRFDELMRKPQKLNPYLYTEGNPINLTDPMGLSSCGSGWNQWVVPDNLFGWYSFTGPCSNHDDCYGCGGAKAGKTKADCDSAFLRDMQSVCSTLQPNSYWRNHCEGTAYIYYNAVVTKGQSAFDASRKECCKN